METNIKVGRNQFIFYGFLLVYAIVLLFLCKELNIWEDEAYSLQTTSNSLPEVLKLSYNFEAQPPAYFILLTLWRGINQGIFFARLFSMFCIGIAAYYIYKIDIAGSSEANRRWIVILFLLNPFSVWAALEIRTYALLILLSTLSIYYFLQYDRTNSKRHLYIFLVTCLIGLYTQYFYAFLIASLAFTFFIFRGWKPFIRLCLYLFPVILLFLPNFFFIFDQVSHYSSNRIDYSSLTQFVKVFSSPQNLILALDIAPFEWIVRWSIKIVVFAFVIYAYFVLYKSIRSINHSLFKSINFLTVITFILIFLFCIVIVSFKIMYQYKYLAIAFPLFILLLNLFRVYSLSTRLITFISISFYFIFLLSFNYYSLVKKQDYIAAASFVKSIEQSNEPIIFYPKSLLLAFSHYYSGENVLVPILPLIFNQDYYENDINDTEEAMKLIEKVPTLSESYILINDTIRGFRLTPKFNNRMFDQCIKSNFKVELDTIIPGNGKDYYLRIRRLHKPNNKVESAILSK